MANGEQNEAELQEAARLSILKKITAASANSTGYKGVLELAMAYTVLSRGKLPGEVPKA